MKASRGRMKPPGDTSVWRSGFVVQATPIRYLVFSLQELPVIFTAATVEEPRTDRCVK